jgi:hypothetical protein
VEVRRSVAKGRGRKRKPTGRTEALILGGGLPPEIRRVQWPEQKEEIERQMLESALRSPKRGPCILAELYQLGGRPEQNPENHFDFMLPTKRGNEYLDTVEFAPLDRKGGSYEAGSTYHIRGEMVDLFWETVAAKARKYVSATTTPLHLLVYSTDFRLYADEQTLLLVALRANMERHPFASIANYSPDDLTSGEVFIIYPVAGEMFENINEQEMRGQQIVTADFSLGQVTPEGVMRVPLPPIQPPGPGPVTFDVWAEQD